MIFGLSVETWALIIIVIFFGSMIVDLAWDLVKTIKHRRLYK